MHSTPLSSSSSSSSSSLSSSNLNYLHSYLLRAYNSGPCRAVSCIAVLVYKCQHGMAPQYLQAYCKPMSACSSRRLRSVSSSLLAVPRTWTNYGDRSFAVYGPRVWNSLPDELRSPDITLTTFRNKLKTLLLNV